MSLSIDADLTGAHDSSRLAKAWEVALTHNPVAVPTPAAPPAPRWGSSGGGIAAVAAVSSSVPAGARSAQDGLAVVQTADSALQEVGALLRRMEILATMVSSSAQLSPAAKAALQSKYEDLKFEVTRLQSSANVKGLDVFSGHNLTFKTGSAPEATVTIDAATTLAPVSAAHLSSSDHAGVRAAMQQVATQRSDLAALQDTFVQSLRSYSTSFAAEPQPGQPSVTAPGPAESNTGSGLSLLI